MSFYEIKLDGIAPLGVGVFDQTVSVWRNTENHRLYLRVPHDDGFSCTDVELDDLVRWLEAISQRDVTEINIRRVSTSEKDHE